MPQRVDPEILFAQSLASNFETQRRKAFKKLKKWLSARTTGGKALSKDELLKVWKGLFYCMWMCDKPLPQEELAKEISTIIHSLNNVKTAFLFIDTFFQTMAREWFGIDAIRLDKFMMMVRKFLRECLQLVHRLKWKPKALKRFIMILKKTVLHPNCDQTPEGFKIHFADVYLQELARVGGGKLTPKKCLVLLAPCCQFLAYAENPVLRKSFAKNVFLAILELSLPAEDSEEEEEQPQEEAAQSEDDDDTGLSRFDFHSKIIKANQPNLESYQDLPALPLKFKTIGKLLMKYGSKDDVKQKNRNQLYNLAKMFFDAAEGVNPFEKDLCDPDGPELKRADVVKAAKRALKEQEEYRKETKEWRAKLRKMPKPEIITENLLEEEFLKSDFGEFGNMKETETKSNSQSKDGKGKKKCKAKAGEQTATEKSVESPHKKQKVNGEVKEESLPQELSNNSSSLEESVEALDDEQPVQKNAEDTTENTVPSVKQKKKKAKGAKKKLTQQKESAKQYSPEPKNKEDTVTQSNVKLTIKKSKLMKKKVLVEKLKEATGASLQTNGANQPTETPKLSSPKKKQLRKGTSKQQKLSTSKRVNFALKNNTTHGHADYHESVRDSPSIPFDADKKPAQGVLKVRENNEQQNQKMNGSSIPKKRMKAIDFF